MVIEALDRKGASLGFSYTSGKSDRDIKAAIADLSEQLAEEGATPARFQARQGGRIVATQAAAPREAIA